MAAHDTKDGGTRATRMYTVTRASVDEFRQSRQAWNALTAAMSYPTVFCSWEWIHTWWERFGQGRDLQILFIRKDGRLAGILPLFSEQRRLPRRDGKIGRILGYCGVPELYPDPLDIISAEPDARPCIKAVRAYLDIHRGEWDVMQLRYVPQDSALVRALIAAPDESGNHLQQVSAAPFISVTGTYEDYLQTLSSNERSNVRRRRRKLLEGQGVAYTDFVGEDTQTVLIQLFALHERRAGEKDIHSTFSGDRIKAFHADLLRQLDPTSVWLRGLRYRDEVIAVFYGFASGGRVSYYQLGYNPEWSELSPGSVLLQETIREAFERGYTEYNFLQGEEGFKYRWTTQARGLYAVEVFNRSVWGGVSKLMTNAKRWLKWFRPGGTVAAVTHTT